MNKCPILGVNSALIKEDEDLGPGAYDARDPMIN